jgi:hypothetical protein
MQKVADPSRKDLLTFNYCCFQTIGAEHFAPFVELAPTPGVIWCIAVGRQKNYFASGSAGFVTIRSEQ